MNFPFGFSSILVIIYRFGEKEDGKGTDGSEPTPKFPVRDIRITKIYGIHTFSVTSGTIFHSHKLDFKVILLAIVIFSNATKGISALQLSRDLDVQYKTAWVLSHKIRESLIEKKSNSVDRKSVV